MSPAPFWCRCSKKEKSHFRWLVVIDGSKQTTYSHTSKPGTRSATLPLQALPQWMRNFSRLLNLWCRRRSRRAPISTSPNGGRALCLRLRLKLEIYVLRHRAFLLEQAAAEVIWRQWSSPDRTSLEHWHGFRRRQVAARRESLSPAEVMPLSAQPPASAFRDDRSSHV